MNILQMSVSAGLLVVGIVILRALALDKLPKKMFLALWGVALLRLLLPVSVPAPFGLRSAVENIGTNIVVETKNHVPDLFFSGEFGETPNQLTSRPPQAAESMPEKPVEPDFGPNIEPALLVWIAGMVAMGAYFTAIYLKNHRELRFCVPMRASEVASEVLGGKRKINIMQSDKITTPVAVGLLRPRIILPKSMDMDDKELLRYVFAHEYIHIRRLDMVWKMVLVAALCVHWFNPMVWVMFVLASRDLELACDAMVLRRFGTEKRSVYAYSIISIAEQRKKLSLLYSSFSKNKTEERITSIMKYKKTSILGVIISALLVTGMMAAVTLNIYSPQNAAENQTGYYGQKPSTNAVSAAPIIDMAVDNVIAAVDANGKVYMWGNGFDTYGLYDIPDDLPPIRKIDVNHHCVIALGEDGKLYGWGQKGYDDRTYGAMDFLSDEYKDMTFIDVTAGGYHSAAVSSEGKVYAWGSKNSNMGTAVPPDLPPVVSIHYSAYRATAMDAEGNVYTWDGRCDTAEKLYDGQKAVTVATLGYETLALGKDGKIYGETKQKSTTSEFLEQPHIENIKSIHGGMSNIAAIDDKGKVYIWGEFYEYEYLVKVEPVYNVPLNLPPIAKIVLGFDFAIALGEDGKIYHWGIGESPPEAINGFARTKPEFAETKREAPSKPDSSGAGNTAEFEKALKDRASTIYVEGTVDVDKDVNILENQKIHILPGGVLNIHTHNFFVDGDIVNEGIINVHGRIGIINKEPSKFGVVNVYVYSENGWGGVNFMSDNDLTVGEVKRLLNGELPYTGIFMRSIFASKRPMVVIDEDYTLPEGKMLVADIKVEKGVTFTVNGSVEWIDSLINDGTIVGNIEYDDKYGGYSIKGK